MEKGTVEKETSIIKKALLTRTEEEVVSPVCLVGKRSWSNQTRRVNTKWLDQAYQKSTKNQKIKIKKIQKVRLFLFTRE